MRSGNSRWGLGVAEPFAGWLRMIGYEAWKSTVLECGNCGFADSSCYAP
jgi:hypothetical protein